MYDLIRRQAAEVVVRQNQEAEQAKALRSERVRQDMAEIEKEAKKKGTTTEETEALWFYRNVRRKFESDARHRQKKKEKGNV